MVGLIGEGKKHMTLNFKNEGDLIYLLGESKNDIGCSHYLAHYKKVSQSPAPYFNLNEEHALHQSVLAAINGKLIESAHDVSEGGLMVCLLESALSGNFGMQIESTRAGALRKDAFLFGEAQGRVVVSVNPKNKAAFESLMTQNKMSFECLGTVVKGDISVNGMAFGSIETYKNIHENSLEAQLS